MYKPSVDLCEHAFVVIWIVTQEFASLFWKSALTCISWTQPRAASKRDGWDIIETTRGQQVRQSLEMKPFPPLDHRNNVRQSWRKKLSRDSHPVATEIPAQEILSLANPATGRHWAAPVPSCSEHDAARLENAEVWIKWSRDCTTENINVNIILGFAILHLKYSTNPFILPPTILLLGCLFCFFFFSFLFFHKSTYNKICTERS